MVGQANLYLHQVVNAAAASVSLEQASQYKIIKYRHCTVVDGPHSNGLMDGLWILASCENIKFIKFGMYSNKKFVAFLYHIRNQNQHDKQIRPKIPMVTSVTWRLNELSFTNAKFYSHLVRKISARPDSHLCSQTLTSHLCLWPGAYFNSGDRDSETSFCQ